MIFLLFNLIRFFKPAPSNCFYSIDTLFFLSVTYFHLNCNPTSLLLLNIHFTMAAAVLSPMSKMSLDGGIMPPSPVSQNSSRHGRGKHGGSVAKGNRARGRGYSTVDDRETIINKAVTFVLKRTVTEDEEQEEDDERLVADGEGWVDLDDLVSILPLLTYLENIANNCSP
jgi:hypothetical protein